MQNFVSVNSPNEKCRFVASCNGEGGRKARKRGKGKVEAFLTLPPQSTSFSPFLPIPYTFRRLLRMLSKPPGLLTDFVLLYIHRINKARDREAIRWLKTPRSLSVHTLIWFITQDDKKRRFEIVSYFGSIYR